MKVALLLIVVALAGCVSTKEVPNTAEAPDAVPDPNDNKAPPTNVSAIPQITETYYASTGCDVVVFVHPISFEDATPLMPVGFTPADIGELLDLPTRHDIGAIGLITFTCAWSNMTGGEFSSASVNIFVDAPNIPELANEPKAFVNTYELKRFGSNPTVVAAYAAATWNISSMEEPTISMHIPDNEPPATLHSRQPSPLVAQSDGGTGNGTWSGSIAGATTYHLGGKTVRFWQETPAGLNFDEFVLTRNGRGAVAECAYTGEIASLLGRNRCSGQPATDPNSGTPHPLTIYDGLGIGITQTDAVGKVVHLPGRLA